MERRQLILRLAGLTSMDFWVFSFFAGGLAIDASRHWQLSETAHGLTEYTTLLLGAPLPPCMCWWWRFSGPTAWLDTLGALPGRGGARVERSHSGIIAPLSVRLGRCPQSAARGGFHATLPLAVAAPCRLRVVGSKSATWWEARTARNRLRRRADPINSQQSCAWNFYISSDFPLVHALYVGQALSPGASEAGMTVEQLLDLRRPHQLGMGGQAGPLPPRSSPQAAPFVP
jgi:hypothetical protein